MAWRRVTATCRFMKQGRCSGKGCRGGKRDRGALRLIWLFMRGDFCTYLERDIFCDDYIPLMMPWFLLILITGAWLGRDSGQVDARLKRGAGGRRQTSKRTTKVAGEGVTRSFFLSSRDFSLHCLLSCHLLTVQTRLLVGNEQQPSCWPWWPQPRISVGHLACKIIVWLIYSVHYLFILTCILIPLLKPDSEGAHGCRQKEPQGWDTGPLCWRGSGSSHLFTWDSSTQKLNGWSTGPISEWTNAWSIYPVLHVLVSTSTSKKCPCVATGIQISFCNAHI
jgi:hypothetical protein